VRLAERLRPVLADLDGALAETRAHAAAPGLLRVGFKAGGIGPLLTEVLHAYSAAHPDVRVELTRMEWADDLSGLRSGAVDVVLARPPLDTRGCDAQVLLSDRRVAGLPTWHALAGQAEVTMADLADEPVVTGATPRRSSTTSGPSTRAPTAACPGSGRRCATTRRCSSTSPWATASASRPRPSPTTTGVRTSSSGPSPTCLRCRCCS
jgi:DNA-binding transcriptional LysR family regulator